MLWVLARRSCLVSPLASPPLLPPPVFLIISSDTQAISPCCFSKGRPDGKAASSWAVASKLEISESCEGKVMNFTFSLCLVFFKKTGVHYTQHNSCETTNKYNISGVFEWIKLD